MNMYMQQSYVPQIRNLLCKEDLKSLEMIMVERKLVGIIYLTHILLSRKVGSNHDNKVVI